MEFSRQEDWSGLPFPTSGDLPNPGIESALPVSPALQADALPSEPPGKPQDHFTPNKRGIILETTQENMNSNSISFRK